MKQALRKPGLDAVLIASKDPEALAKFYQRGFQLEQPKWTGKDHLGFSLGNTYLGFDRVSDNATNPGSTVSLWFGVSDIASIFERLVQLGARVKYAPTKEESPGEILAMLFDPDGNTIGLIAPV